jgi:hypothetical protein
MESSLNPPRPPKLSGAELAAQLAGTSFPASVPAAPAKPPSEPVPEPPRSKIGRPAKAGATGLPVNVRLAQDDHVALARIAGELLVPGRPMPTVQDIVRGLIRGALKDTDTLKRLVREGEEA